MPGIWGGSTQRGHKVWLHVLNFDGEIPETTGVSSNDT